jgi:D-alanyl-D-alanine carboxypeptidase/D-alanyl-D-alanine-endopeptidase (penicillin-binding protein 4)
MRRSHAAITFILLLLQAGSFAGEKPEKKDLARQIQAIVRQPGFSRAHWGIDVVDLESGKALFALNSDHLFLPASNAKLLATSAALALVGPEYRFHTTIETSGKIDTNGRLLGDLVIVGRGDPNISGRVVPYQLKTERVSPHTQILEQLADQVVQKGIKIVDGDLIGDDSYYAAERYGEGWAHDDLQWIDGAPVSALTFNDNVLFVKIQPGEKAGEKALVTVDPQTSYYELENRILTTAAGVARKVGIHRDPGSYKVTLWGSVPLDDAGMNEAIAIEDPAEFTAQLFRSLLEARGITFTGKTRAKHGDLAQFFDQPQSPTPLLATPLGPPAQILAEHVSLPLIEDVRVTNKTSQNLHAELDLRLIGQLKGMGGSFEGGAAALKQFLLRAGLKSNEFFVLDGSGLSRRDLITPAAMVQLLLYASRQPWGAAFEQTLPVAGVDGSLAERFVNTPAGGLIHAKTGTLSHVNALSGYGQTSAGKRFVFSIFCNNHDLPSAKVVAAIDAIVVLLVNGGEPAAKVPGP